ncbi:MAG: Rne/Rng family ribonuclease [SAR324 cluster bacterium]|nr:Rne/Rng family ribonuclease [SAR324 cluster bacterium]
MSKNMLINVTEDETRIGIIEDGLLQELLIEHQNREQNKGNIYKGIVVQINTGVQAAFIDYGQKRHGFLPLSEVNPAIMADGKGKRASSRLKTGQEVLVQVTREEVDQKGAALTTNISLPGRYMVVMPHNSKGGVSKKISDQEERERLKGFIAAMDAEEHSLIVRTAGIGRDLTELKKDYTQIKRKWEDIKEVYNSADGPELIQEEVDVITRSLRDYYAEDIEEIWVDHPEAFQKGLNFLKENYPRRQKDLKLFVGDRSLYATYNIEKQVEQLTTRKVFLKSGGSIVIDQTEALVAIDVNSGRSNQERNVDDTALRTNLEAAEEIARQLRLRNLGGLIVVDFIDMDKSGSRKAVEERMTDSMDRDRAQHKFTPISEFGLIEISRQRMSQRISNVVESSCPTCKGKGMIPSTQASSNLILRGIREVAAKGGVTTVEADLPLSVANHLLNERRQSIMDLEMEFGITICLKGDPSVLMFDEKSLKTNGEKPQVQQKSRKRPAREEQEVFTKDEAPKDESSKDESSKDDAPKDDAEAADSRGGNRNRGRNRKRKPESNRPEESGRFISDSDDEAGKSYDAKKDEAAEAERSVVIAKILNPPPIKTVVSELHPNCLFKDVKELDDVAKEELAESFNMRMKGKAEGKVPALLDEKFLWRPRAIAGLPKPVAPKAEVADAEVAEKPKAAKSTTKKKPATKKPAAKADKGEEEAKPKRGRKPKAEIAEKPAAKKPAAAKAAAKKPAAKKAPAKKATAKKDAEA